MGTGSQVRRRRPSPRVARRRQADRERILRAAAARFAEVGTLQASLDEIAAQADVARGTLYSHFLSKEALVLALVGPVLKDAVGGMDRVDRARSAQARVSAALQLYLQLWAKHPDALRLSHRLMTTQDVAAAAQLHLPFVLRMVAVFATAGRAGILRAPSPELAARTLARVAVPLLELYVPVPGGEALFVEAVSGLLLKQSPRTQAVRRRAPGSG